MEEPHISLKAEELFSVGPISVTNSMLMMFIIMGAILLVGTLIARRATVIPTGKSQSVAEMIVGFLLDLVEGSGGKKLGRRIFPLISGLFIFIIFSNFSGLLPGVGTIGVYKDSEHAAEATGDHSTTEEHDEEPATPDDHDDAGKIASTGDVAGMTTTLAAEEGEQVLVPLMRPPTADLNMTFALSVTAFVAIQIAGVASHGVVGRLKHMADPPFLFPIELIAELSRILSLSARLFGNVFAGEVLLGIMYAIATAIKIAVIPVIFPVIFIGLEVLFGTIQAVVFALLTLIYIMLAAAHSHEDHDEEHAPGHEPSPAPAPAALAAGD
ncbi:MAG TPA: F0F1 ATP synthase subunit A [Thermomicrobiales bacterium]|nr:F0F1 ATP synthase subunit A [Thermomicrobiales bacterium]